MDPEKRSRIMVSIRSVSRLELQAKTMAESQAGCMLRLAGPRVGRARPRPQEGDSWAASAETVVGFGGFCRKSIIFAPQAPLPSFQGAA